MVNNKSIFKTIPILFLVSCFCFSETSVENFDIIIKNGLIYDGTKNPAIVGDVGILDDRIVAIGAIEGKAKKTIDANGLVVAPGFIDVHTHNDWGVSPALLENRTVEESNNVCQGVTTVITGLCGSGNPSIESWFDFLKKRGCYTNVYHLIPHGELRIQLFGYETQKLNDEQLLLLKAKVAEEMQKGAIGLSTGLIYQPSMFADTNELIELCKVLKEYDGIYVSHVRGEDGRRVLDSYNEAVRIGREANVPVQISHMKLTKPFRDVKVLQMLNIIENARAEGIDVTGDQYPYTSAQLSLRKFVPKKFMGSDWIKPEYREGNGRQELETALRATAPKDQEFLHDLLIIDNPADPTMNGKRLTALAELWGISPEEAIIRIIVESRNDIIAATFCINEEDVREIMKHEYVFTGSDQLSNIRISNSRKPGNHPRAYGSFVRKIAKYALQEKAISLNQAIMSMTSLPAKKFRLHGRGELKIGNYADIVVFDVHSLQDYATYEHPDQCAQGIKYVLVNGVIELNDGQLTGDKGGVPLARGSL